LPAFPSLTHLSPEFDISHLWLCRSCKSSLDSNKIPNLAVCNGLELDDVPEEIARLNLMEQRLISTAHCFMTIVELPKGQSGVRGMAITSPFDVGNVVESLPRLPGDEGCVVVRVQKASRVPQRASQLRIGEEQQDPNRPPPPPPRKEFRVRVPFITAALHW
jgi:hypothetical protein